MRGCKCEKVGCVTCYNRNYKALKRSRNPGLARMLKRRMERIAGDLPTVRESRLSQKERELFARLDREEAEFNRLRDRMDILGRRGWAA